jgi:uncharacterized membrane protein YebE (DUF533 family)
MVSWLFALVVVAVVAVLGVAVVAGKRYRNKGKDNRRAQDADTKAKTVHFYPTDQATATPTGTNEVIISETRF